MTYPNLTGIAHIPKVIALHPSILYGVDIMTVPPVLKPYGSLNHCPKENATLFANVFDGEQNNEKLAMPEHCFSEPKLTSLAYRSPKRENN